MVHAVALVLLAVGALLCTSGSVLEWRRWSRTRNRHDLWFNAAITLAAIGFDAQLVLKIAER
jgi:hypothetical protein